MKIHRIGRRLGQRQRANISRLMQGRDESGRRLSLTKHRPPAGSGQSQPLPTRKTGRRQFFSLSRFSFVSRCAPALIALLALLILAEADGLFPTLVLAAPDNLLHVRRKSDAATPVGVVGNGLTVLRQGEPVKQEIGGGEAQILSVELMSGQYAEIVVEWQGLDLDVTVLMPDGRPLIGVDVPVRGSGPVPISIIADAQGSYSLQVRTSENIKVSGSYQVTLQEMRSPTPVDRVRFSAQKLMAEGEEQKSEAAAIEKYLQALHLWQQAEDLSGAAYTLQRLGTKSISAKDKTAAESYYKLAIDARQQLNDRRALAYTLKEIGSDYRSFDSPKKALEYYQQSLNIFRDIGDRTGEASALYNLGFAQAKIGYMKTALEFYQDALAIERAEQDRLSEARTLNAIGGAYSTLGEQDQAMSFYQQAAPIWHELNDRYREAVTDNNLGLVYDDWGEWQEAKDSYSQALAIYKELLNQDLTVCRAGATAQVRRICGAMADALDNIGELYNSLGDPQSALEKFAESMPLRQNLKQPQGLGVTLSRIGYAYLLEDKPAEALKYCEQALPFNQQANDLRKSASTLTFTGMSYAALNAPDKALEYYQQALRLQEEAGERRGQAISLNKIASVYARAGDWPKTFENYNRALGLWREVRDQDGETITLYGIASAERARGHLMEAHLQIEKALQIIESRRGSLTSAQLRTAYFANKENCYELAIDLKMQLGKSSEAEAYSASALETNERARARHLLDTLNEARVGLSERDREPQGNSDPKLAAMLDRKLALERKLNVKARIRASLSGSKETDERAAALAQEITELTNEYDEVEAQIRAYNPRYAALGQPQPLSAREIQQQLLDDKTLLLEYALGEERSYLWAVTPTSLSSYELPKRREIERVAARIKDILTACRKLPGELGRHYQQRLTQADAQYRSEAAALSQMLLGPVAAQLGTKRLVIVAEGILQYIPFGGLPAPASAVTNARPSGLRSPDDSDTSAPLILEHEIINLPSASVLALIRSEAQQRQPAPKAVAVLADPVFERDDPRLSVARQAGEPAKQPKSETASLSRALEDFDVFNDHLRLPRLPSSRQEARDIMAVAPPDGRLEAIDFKASRATATDPLLAQYRIIHFATHGLLDDKHPELSGIVLSLFDERGRPQEDGFLRLHDIYNLRLPVELVVLSACQTGLGKEVRGEGLIGLTRGFMYAGAARVVASLWKVDDAATAELMKRFYIGMFKDHLTPAAALKAAQVSMWEQSRWHNPYFWSGFILQGEWR